ncbi:NAD-dependent epimerase/dehydratase family protein [Oceaniglobus trochenteri]|uniref:NAD-dependent epimerase/dehydratase family protein n=1 Tax=Oceaniglobus trochenteri TaxID=2763260 RepID=UPI001CFFD7C1|nr:NAD(P)-dependent oxidoreductase [Oceaniglobus trochenteri]
MTGKRIFFTGGAGKAGRHVTAWLLKQGHHILNVDRVASPVAGVDNLIADITDAGQMYDAMSGHSNLSELARADGPAGFDAVVHFAAVPRILITTDAEMFRINTLGTYNVIDAALKLGIRKVIIASSETAYGICFANGRVAPQYLPLDEDHDTDPMDAYGLSKVVGEATARSFARRSGADIYALRLAYVVAPDEYPTFTSFRDDPDSRYRSTFSYLDARDLGQIVHRALKTDGLGFQVFNCGNDDNSSDIPTDGLLRRYYPGVPVTRPMGENEALYSNRKIREQLGFREQYNWRNPAPD